MKNFETKILTPDGPVFNGFAASVNVPGTEGNFQILSDHASLMSALEPGEIRVTQSEGSGEVRFSVSVGFVEVANNNVTILAEAAERVENIDVDRAQQALDRAKERIQAAVNNSDIDVLRAEAALQRAQNRLQLARRSN